MKLDKRRSYGRIYGSTEIAFEQDGVFFKSDGTEYKPPEAVTPTETVISKTLHLPELLNPGEDLRKAPDWKEQWKALKAAKVS